MPRRNPHLLADEELMERIGEDDARAFETVYDRHGSAAFSVAYRILGTRAAAEDAVQEAFLSIWRSSARYDPARGSVRSWILGIVHNRTIDTLRRTLTHDRKRASAEGIEEWKQAPERTDEEAERRDDARNVRAALEALPRDQTQVIELAYFGGFTQNEIAKLLDTPLGTVKGRMRLGLQKLRSELAGDGLGEPA